jgi:phosphoribosylformylglycinamidine (FGAM) synthase-like enzyme
VRGVYRSQHGCMARAKSKIPPASPLQSAYRRALSASVVAHARYLAVQGDKSVTQRQIVQQKIAWQSMEARKAKIRARLILVGDATGPD